MALSPSDVETPVLMWQSGDSECVCPSWITWSGSENVNRRWSIWPRDLWSVREDWLIGLVWFISCLPLTGPCRSGSADGSLSWWWSSSTSTVPLSDESAEAVAGGGASLSSEGGVFNPGGGAGIQRVTGLYTGTGDWWIIQTWLWTDASSPSL